MSEARPRRNPPHPQWGRSAARAGILAAAVWATGCWEQWSEEWWPQMKYQKAVQAFEDTGSERYPGGFPPPPGSVPVGSETPPPGELDTPAQEALQNPHVADLASLERGREQYTIFCTPCHGSTGGGDGPVAGPPFGTGPFVAVLPIGGPTSIARGLTDGHIYTTISEGRGRMPNYRRIPAAWRWDIVNYLRYLNGQVGPQTTATAGEAP